MDRKETLMTTTIAIETRGRELVRWTRLAVLGFLMAAAGELLMIVAIVTFGLDSEGETGFLGALAAIALVAALLVWRFGWWAKALGIVAGLMSAMALFWTAFGLGSPQSFFDIMPAVLVIPGALIGAGSCIAAIVAGRRGHRTSGPQGGEGRGIAIALAVVAIAAVVSGALTFLGRSSADPAGAGATVVMSGFEFDRDAYALRPGSTVFVRNDDPFMHDFTVDALGISVKTSPGDRVLVTIPDKPGTYVLYCTLHSSGDADDAGEDNDMSARLIVSA
jgi:plastocyanin